MAFECAARSAELKVIRSSRLIATITPLTLVRSVPKTVARPPGLTPASKLAAFTTTGLLAACGPIAAVVRTR